VLCGYYDAKPVDAMKANIHKWIVVSKGAPKINGFMYTTWKRQFDPWLKQYFGLLDTYGQWATTIARAQGHGGRRGRGVSERWAWASCPWNGLGTIRIAGCYGSDAEEPLRPIRPRTK